MHIATLFGYEPIVKLLLKAGASPSKVSEVCQLLILSSLCIYLINMLEWGHTIDYCC